jgi:hypothetical protein
VAVVISRADELGREFEKLRGEVRAVKDSAGLNMQEVERQRESVDRTVAVVISRADEMRREFEKLRGEVRAVKDSAGGNRQEVAKSVSGLETLRREFEDLKGAVERLQQSFLRVGSPKPGDSSSQRDKAANPTPVPPTQSPTPRPSRTMAITTTTTSLPSLNRPTPQKSQGEVDIPMGYDDNLDGIISYLTKKHGGNVHQMGLVTITSKSVYSDDPEYALRNIADLTAGSGFFSKNEPGQWVCWDFGEMRVHLTHYTISSGEFLRSWVVEGSDGTSSNWKEIDWKLNQSNVLRRSFAVSNPAGFRFIRLTQTANHPCLRRTRWPFSRSDWSWLDLEDFLILYAVEFFGTLST